MAMGNLVVMMQRWLSRRFTAAIVEVNKLLVEYAKTAGMSFLDCSSHFLTGTGTIDAAYMPDGVRLNTAGMERLAVCIEPMLQDVMR